MAKQAQENQLSEATQQRLLEAAGEVFAEHGFKAATVREISTKAGANVAAVNYHFGGKEGLYKAVFRLAHRCSHGQAEQMMGSGLNVEERLGLFVRGFLENIFCEGQAAWHGKLMTREMTEPTSALDELVREEIQPRECVLEGICRELLGKNATKDQAEFCARSVIGQMIFYYHARPVITRLFPDFEYGPEGIVKVAEHVTRFSLAGMRKYKDEGRGR
ncbi:MAG TPA: CerR family C-terminal domain-containing protein [Tepidisphaeraceae bacterium]|jgi:AcrR family transcriptional regulator|nr:CerR family C-terminal domain-containing protein [Tepidisphaeraceae bacterium]